MNKLIASTATALTLATAALAQAPLRLPKRVLCPVDGKNVEVAAATPTVIVNGIPQSFCAASCRDRFAAWPEKYVKGPVYCTVQPNFKGWFQVSRRVEVNHGLYYLCCDPCVGYMREKPWFYLKEAEIRDAVSGRPFKPAESSLRSDYKGQIYLFESAETRAQFDKEPQKFAILFRR